jgi:hypothetical protein
MIKGYQRLIILVSWVQTHLPFCSPSKSFEWMFIPPFICYFSCWIHSHSGTASRCTCRLASAFWTLRSFNRSAFGENPWEALQSWCREIRILIWESGFGSLFKQIIRKDHILDPHWIHIESTSSIIPLRNQRDGEMGLVRMVRDQNQVDSVDSKNSSTFVMR